MKTFILFSLLSIASCIPLTSDAGDRYVNEQRNSWERQADEQRYRNYDSYRNGPTVETMEQQRRAQRRQEEQERLATQRRETAERNRRQSYGQTGGDTCRGLYGC
jgi:hypothetical protein